VQDVDTAAGTPAGPPGVGLGNTAPGVEVGGLADVPALAEGECDEVTCAVELLPQAMSPSAVAAASKLRIRMRGGILLQGPGMNSER
jgi:hypothetical protein